MHKSWIISHSKWMKTGSSSQFRVCNCVSFLRKVLIIQHNYLVVCREFSSQRESRLHWEANWNAWIEFEVLAIKVVNASPLSYPSDIIKYALWHGRNKHFIAIKFINFLFRSSMFHFHIHFAAPEKGFFVCLMYHRVLVHIHLLRGTSVSGMRQWS